MTETTKVPPLNIHEKARILVDMVRKNTQSNDPTYASDISVVAYALQKAFEDGVEAEFRRVKHVSEI